MRSRPAEGAKSLKESGVEVAAVSRIWRWRTKVLWRGTKTEDTSVICEHTPDT